MLHYSGTSTQLYILPQRFLLGGEKLRRTRDHEPQKTEHLNIIGIGRKHWECQKSHAPDSDCLFTWHAGLLTCVILSLQQVKVKVWEVPSFFAGSINWQQGEGVYRKIFFLISIINKLLKVAFRTLRRCLLWPISWLLSGWTSMHDALLHKAAVLLQKSWLF